MSFLIQLFIKYLSAGGIATFVHYTIYILLVKIAIKPWAATLVAASIGAIIAYLLNYYLTFASSSSHKIVIPRFFIVSVFVIILQTIIVYYCTSQLKINYFLAQLLATGVSLILTFIINYLWTFK